MRSLFVPLACAALLVACSNNGGNGADASADAAPDQNAPVGCLTDSECPAAGDHCYFAIDAGCSIAGSNGVCLYYAQTAGCTPNVACGCDGTTISVCAPPGYVDRVSNYAGACPSDGGTDGGADDGATDDASDAAAE